MKEKKIPKFLSVAVLLLVIGILLYKALNEGWLMPRQPLDFSHAPIILFFNRHKGCECEMVVYTAAKNQMSKWILEEQYGIPMIPIDLDRRPDLGKQFGIIRAPALLIVGQGGEVIYSQKDPISDTAPLDLLSLDRALEKLIHGK